jgi:hypothetical protein
VADDWPDKSRLGSLALRKGLISEPELTRLLKVQKNMRKSGVRRRIGQMMVLHEFVTPAELEELLKEQEKLRKNP